MDPRALILCLLTACASEASRAPPPTVSPDPAADAAIAPTAPEPAPQAHDFLPGLRPLTCDAPEGELVAFCVRVGDLQETFRERWLVRARAFFTATVPGDVPTTVVYPFAGGDLATALTVFPEAVELTTVSLEPAGDPRTLPTLKPSALRAALAAVTDEMDHLTRMMFSNTSDLLDSTTQGSLPTQLILSLAALRLHGFEPISIHYFSLDAHGAVDYLTDAEVAALAPVRDVVTHKRNYAFGDVEIRFRRPGETAARIYRHIRANLENEHLAKDDRVIRHLAAKRDIAAMTKAASYLLTWSTFSTIRDYLLGHASWMVSDATGPLASDAQRAGFTVETYGRYDGAHMSGGGKATKEWRPIFKKQPQRALGFRFGYPDSGSHDHLIITKRVSSPR